MGESPYPALACKGLRLDPRHYSPIAILPPQPTRPPVPTNSVGRTRVGMAEFGDPAHNLWAGLNIMNKIGILVNKINTQFARINICSSGELTRIIHMMLKMLALCLRLLRRYAPRNDILCVSLRGCRRRPWQSYLNL